jgi:hypothetical protein
VIRAEDEMNSKWIMVATFVLAAACAPMEDDDLTGTGDAPFSSDDEEEEESLEGIRQAVTFDPSCAQWQRDVLSNANWYVWLLANEALYNWTTQPHVSRRLRWFGAFGGDVRGRTQAIHDLALTGGPTRFYCSANPLGTARSGQAITRTLSPDRSLLDLRSAS